MRFRLYYMKKGILVSILFFTLILESFGQAGVFVGGHIRRERPATITKLKNSGFEYVILFNVHVEKDGTLTTDGDTICHNGQYVFGNKHPHYVSDVKVLVTQPTSINRLEICIGGWGNTAYDNIKALANSQGLGENSILYRNFKALKDTLPEIIAVNNDDEHTYDVAAATSFHVMMYDLGFKTTLAPYMNKPFWQSLAQNVNAQRPTAIERVLIQCYDGGAGNNPNDWHLGDIPLHAGRLNYQDFNETKTTIQDWKQNKNVIGIFFWVYNDETWNLSKYASAVNRIYQTLKTTDEGAATFYEDYNYGGYSVQLPAGEFTTLDMVNYGLADDDLTSLKVNEAYKVIAYFEDNFQGTSRTFTGNTAWIGNSANDKISSLKIEKINNSSVQSAKEIGIEIYPNPVDDYLYVKSEKQIELSLIDLNGKIILSNKVFNIGVNQIYVGYLPNGTYSVILKNGTATFNIKIVKK